MAELAISQLIKIILGVLVFVAVVIGVYVFFKDHVIGLFTGYGNSSGVFWSLLLK